MAMTKEQALALASARLRLQQSQQQPAQQSPSIPDQLIRQAGLGGRAIVQGITDLAAPFADPLAGIANKG